MSAHRSLHIWLNLVSSEAFGQIIHFSSANIPITYLHVISLQVCSYTVDGMQLLKEFDMPSPMTFKEEGGVSLSPDGTKFIAVSFTHYTVNLFDLSFLCPTN